jgi:hypothetical protein
MAKKIASWLTFLSILCYAIAFVTPVLQVTADVNYDNEYKGERNRNYAALEIVAAAMPPLYYDAAPVAVAAVLSDAPADVTVTSEWATAASQGSYAGMRVLTAIAFCLPLLLWLYYFSHRWRSIRLRNVAASLLLLAIIVTVLLSLPADVRLDRYDLIDEPVNQIHVVFQDVMLQRGMIWAGVSLLLAIGAAVGVRRE